MFVGVLTKPHFFTLEYALREKCPHSVFFWSVFSRIRTKYGEIPSVSLYSVRMRENTYHNNSEYGHFPRSDRDSCSYIAVSRKYRIPENHRWCISLYVDTIAILLNCYETKETWNRSNTIGNFFIKIPCYGFWLVSSMYFIYINFNRVSLSTFSWTQSKKRKLNFNDVVKLKILEIFQIFTKFVMKIRVNVLLRFLIRNICK